MKVALYARYSSDSQRDASIADQLRVCRAHAERQGWHIVEEYTDHAISGASLLRPGIQAMIADAVRPAAAVPVIVGVCCASCAEVLSPNTLSLDRLIEAKLRELDG